MNDENLVLLAQKGNDNSMEVLLEKYKSLVRTVTRMYFLTGADSEDLLQEGMIGLYKAILSYIPDMNSNFGKYAELCIKRQVLSAIKAANRLKHLPLNSYVSIYKEDEDGSEIDTRYEFEGVSGGVLDPEEITINRETNEILRRNIDNILSDFEKAVLFKFLNGESYAEIAKSLKKEPKAIDNALQRVKRKLKNKI